MDRERFKKQLDFILEADKEKKILRQTHVIGYERQENDAEHAWHMAIMIYLLKEYANEEFEACETPEARFVRAMDNLQPLLLNDANEGRDWRAHNVHKAQVEKRNAKTKLGSEEIWKAAMEIVEANVKKGHIKE